jgi:hypothetical protein
MDLSSARCVGRFLLRIAAGNNQPNFEIVPNVSLSGWLGRILAINALIFLPAHSKALLRHNQMFLFLRV